MLVATDFSEASEAALHYGRELARTFGATLHVLHVANNLRENQSALAIERSLRQVVQDVKHELHIPVAVKLSPFFTAFSHVAHELDRAGADGLVLFNRFLQSDIDIQHLAVWPRLELSDSAELLLRLRWLAILHGRLRCSLAANGGVATPNDGIKAILAGAHAVKLEAALLTAG